MIRIVTLCVALLLLAAPCMAQSITFAWDLSADDASLGAGGGYRVYMGKQSRTYTGVICSAPPGVNTCTGTASQLGNLYFGATAFTSDKVESDYSNEVSQVVKPRPPTLKSAVQTALTAPIRGITKLAGLLKKDKGLRIIG